MASAAPNHSRSWLRNYGLKIIFAFTYTMLMLMIFEQGRIISAQQALIRQLYVDSVQLNALKVQQLSQNRH